jgi:hypothetical protein
MKRKILKSINISMLMMPTVILFHATAQDVQSVEISLQAIPEQGQIQYSYNPLTPQLFAVDNKNNGQTGIECTGK